MSNVGLSSEEQAHAESVTQQLVDAAIENGGTYYLTYQLYPTPEQLHRAYPKARRRSSASASTTRTRSSPASSTRNMATPSRTDRAPRPLRRKILIADLLSLLALSAAWLLRVRASVQGTLVTKPARTLVFAPPRLRRPRAGQQSLRRGAGARRGHGRRGRGRPAHPRRRAGHLPRPERRPAHRRTPATCGTRPWPRCSRSTWDPRPTRR